ncbi:MAG: DUF1304 family protein, partial [Chitinophagales bacterium]|nr:DUF1304 family protein [Chitinophagales bacterium]
YVSYFFLTCIIIAGIYGAVTIEKSIFYKQSIPAIFALAFTIISQRIT